ncbi:hypothetical protein HPB52_019035 [Rhipicephalus sanguineus]|uniref:Uncharacterized protein n=1 Tax=Rhipicephalus sanguineus TaxID=34632 RepID=A0A9D4SZQ3_RHISA|nr:hypothetical protein HPB52_019035 [Rhipicephalus sanguineus]
MDQAKKSDGCALPSGMSRKSTSADSVASTDSVAAVSTNDKDAIAKIEVEKADEAHMARSEIPGALERTPQTIGEKQEAGGSEPVAADPTVISAPGTGGMASNTVTSEGAAMAAARESSSRTSSTSIESVSRAKRSRHKKRRRKKKGRREPVVVVSRSNIIRDPLYVCLGQSFPSDDDARNAAAAAAADPKQASSAGADNVVAYVTSTNVDGPGLSSASNAATVEKAAAEQAELIEEKAVLNAVLRDLMECLELHSSKYAKNEEDAEEMGNGLVKARKKRTGASSKGEAKRKSSPDDNRRSKSDESEDRRLDVPMGEVSWLQAQRLSTAQAKQAVEPHYQQAITGREKALKSPENKERDCVVDKGPECPAAAAELGHFEDKHHKQSQDVVGRAASKRYEAPLVFFSASRTESRSGQGSSGYVAGSETSKEDDDDEEEDRGYLGMAFGGDSLTEDLGLAQVESVNASSLNMASGIQGCWHDFLAPIKMVSKYIQTECWNEPETESSFSEVVRKHRSGSSKALQRACSLQIAVPEHQADAAGGLRSEGSSVEELAKIFAAYSSSPASRQGNDEFGRADVKGVVRDRNFGVPSPTGDPGMTTASPPAVQVCTCSDGRSSANVLYKSAAE